MNRLYKLVFVIFLLAIPFWYGPVIVSDLSSPELWGDWRHDPRWYLPALLIPAVGTIAVFVHGIRWRRRWDRMTPEQKYEESLRILKRRW